MNRTLHRTALAILATTAVAGALVSCSSGGDASAAGSVAADVPESGDSPAPADAAAPEDVAGMTSVFQRYVETSNSGQSQEYLATICSTDPVHSQVLEDRDPSPYPVSVVDMTDFTVDGDNGLATVTVKIGLEESANQITQRFTFVREAGAWTACGEQKD